MDQNGGKMMVKSCVVGAVGKSAPVMTELVKWLIESKGEYISDVVQLVSKDEEVLKQAELVQSALEASEWNLRVHWKEMEFDDITSADENYSFLKESVETIYEEKSKHGVDNIYLNLAGGRKSMSIGLHMLAQFNPVDGSFHVISPQISNFNEKLEREKDKIDEHYHADNLTAYYKENNDVFDPILFPPLPEFKVIPMPILPFPTRIIKDYRKIWNSDTKVKRSELEYLTDNDLYRARKLGLVQHSGKNYVNSTSLGKKLLAIIK